MYIFSEHTFFTQKPPKQLLFFVDYVWLILLILDYI